MEFDKAIKKAMDRSAKYASSMQFVNILNDLGAFNIYRCKSKDSIHSKITNSFYVYG